MKGECPIEIDPKDFWLTEKERNTYISVPANGGRLALPANEDIHFYLKDNRITFQDGTRVSMGGKLGDFCRSMRINVDAECIILFDLEASTGTTLEANGKHSIVGLPFDQFIIRTTVATRISFIASIYPFPIILDSIEHYENDIPINYTIVVPGVSEQIFAPATPITSFTFFTGVAACRIAYDRAALITDPLIPPGTPIDMDRKITVGIFAIGIGFTTFNGWGLY